MWRGGCIIRSAFLGKIKEAYEVDPELPNLLLAPYFVETIQKCESAWRQVVSQAALLGFVPLIGSAWEGVDTKLNPLIVASQSPCVHHHCRSTC